MTTDPFDWGFVDETLNQLLYLTPREGRIAVIPLADLLDVQQNLPLGRTACPCHPN